MRQGWGWERVGWGWGWKEALVVVCRVGLVVSGGRGPIVANQSGGRVWGGIRGIVSLLSLVMDWWKVRDGERDPVQSLLVKQWVGNGWLGQLVYQRPVDGVRSGAG